MTEADVTRWAPRLRAMARRWVRDWAWHQDRALIEDCEGAGWLVLAERGPDDPRLGWEIQNAMQDTITRWLYGVTRGQRPRRAEIAWCLTEAIRSQDVSPLDRVLAREAWVQLGPAHRAQLEQAAWPLRSSGRHGDWRVLRRNGRPPRRPRRPDSGDHAPSSARLTPADAVA